MDGNELAGTEARTDGDAPTPEQRCDLSKFQLRILAVLAYAEDAPMGLAVKERMESYYRGRVNHGRMYPNLDELEEMGLVEKRARDQRTNEYDLTDEGRSVLTDEIAWLVSRVGGVPENGGDEE